MPDCEGAADGESAAFSYTWKKSSYSQGQSNCVEVGLRPWDWVKSSYSCGQNNCVETACDGHAVKVRDTKDTSIPGITVTPQAWTAFLDYIE